MTSPAQNVVTIDGAGGSFEAAIVAALANLTNPDLGYQKFRFISYEVAQFKGPVSHRLGSRTIEPGSSYEVVLNVTYEDFS